MRRAWSLRVVLATTMVVVAVSATAVVGVIGHRITAGELTAAAEAQLEAVLHARARAIDDGLERLRSEVSVLAEDPTVARALVEFAAAIEDLEAVGDELVDDRQRDEVRAVYEAALADPDRVQAFETLGLPLPTVDELAPTDPVTVHLQDHYLLPAPEDPEARTEVLDAGDGSTWSAVHARYHPFLRDVAEASDFGDLVLVHASGRVAYTVRKGADLGIDLTDTVFDTAGLARLGEELARAPVGDAALIDFEAYLGGLSGPAMQVAALVRDGETLVGVLLVQVTPDALSALMTGNGSWEEVGLGRTGETYVVGRDLRLRSDARGWIEDPAAHLERLREVGLDDVAAAVELFDSTILVQEVDTEPVAEALAGGRFVGAATDGIGREVLSVAEPLGVIGLDWVVVGEIERDEALAELDGYLRDVLLLAAILVPLVAAAGVWLASRATRPVDPLVAAAERVAAGDLDLGFRDDSRDEFGHLARQLVRRAEGLAAEDAALAQQRRAIDELLLAVLPDRLLEAVRSGQLDLGDLADTATVATITIDGLGAAEDEVVSLVASRLEVLAGVYRMERAWSSTDRHLYLAGLGRDDDHGCDDAVAFMREAFAVVTDLTGEAGLRVALHGALAAGDVATGIVGGERLALGVWGRAPRHALALDAAAPVGGVLVELGVVERAGDAGLPSAPTTTVQDGSETLDAVVWRPLLDDAVLGDDAPGEAISRPS